MAKFHAPRHNDVRDKDGSRRKGEGDIPDDDGRGFSLSFTHRDVPPFIATALGLFNSSNARAEKFPTDRINWPRSWRMAEMIPCLGHVGLENLTCNNLSMDPEDDKEYVRSIALRPIPSCEDGPGASYAFDQFAEVVGKGMEQFRDFDGVCGNGDHGHEENVGAVDTQTHE